MESLILENLEWPELLRRLCAGARTVEGAAICANLSTDLSPEEIDRQWQAIDPIRDLIRSGYTPPIGELGDMAPCFRAAELGQVLDGEDLRSVFNLLDATRQLDLFLRDFSDRCASLKPYQHRVYPLPNLSRDIDKAISPDGQINDDASPELKKIRQNKLSLRKNTEAQIRRLLVDQQLETYLQDKFFTIRSERYVVPIRLDGRGRVKGSIYDTSDSGQTLFIEPASIAPLNEKLLELDLSEKLEIIRIFRELSAGVAAELDILKGNYENLIELDVLCAKGRLAYEQNASPVKLTDEPLLNLKKARHPLVRSPSGETAVANDIRLEPGQCSLVVSGPNAGGKTVVLKTVGMLHIMARAGLLLPADPESEVFLFRNLFLAMGDPQSLEANLSTFSGHVTSLKPILEKSGSSDLVMLDELAVGTEPQTGSALAQAILEHLADHKVITVATTHFDSLKGLAVSDGRFRNGSMEFSTRSLKPTYQLILDLPGQSYGLEVAGQIGLPVAVMERARELRGTSGADLDALVKSFAVSREELAREKQALHRSRLEMEEKKRHWELERKALQAQRAEVSKKLAARFEQSNQKLREEVEETLAKLKKTIRETRQAGEGAPPLEVLHKDRQKAVEGLSELESNLGRLEAEYDKDRIIPGVPCTLDDLRIGSRVYVVSLGKEGVVSNIQEGSAPVEIRAGLLRLRPALQELRLLDDQKETPPAGKGTGAAGRLEKPNDDRSSEVPLVHPTSTNSLDLRGLEVDEALNRTWEFIDKALLRGESGVVVIHGHGTDALKKAIRSALARGSPYDLDFRPGEKAEGGDGVTVIRIN